MVKSRKLVEEYRKQIGRFTYKEMDCIRSIENIISRYGGRSATVGSNWWARHEIVNLRPLKSKSQLYDGCAVLKTILPGQSGYGLPARYKNDAVKIDYNHIGLGTDSGEILDSTRTASGRDGPGVSDAPINSNSWDVIGDFEDVDYSDRFDSPVPTDDGGDFQVANEPVVRRVVAESGNTVNLRPSKKASGIVLAYVPVGADVTVYYTEGEWARVGFEGKDGWMMERYLSPEEATFVEPEFQEEAYGQEELASLPELIDEADQLIERLAGLLFRIRGAT